MKINTEKFAPAEKPRKRPAKRKIYRIAWRVGENKKSAVLPLRLEEKEEQRKEIKPRIKIDEVVKKSELQKEHSRDIAWINKIRRRRR